MITNLNVHPYAIKIVKKIVILMRIFVQNAKIKMNF